MAKTFHLTIAKIGENVFDGDAVSALVPGKEGVFEVLASHEPMVAELKEGIVHYTIADGSEHQHEIVGGIAEISNNQATILL